MQTISRPEKTRVRYRVARAAVERQRGNGSSYVFAHRNEGQMRPYFTMNTNGWQAVWKRANVGDVRVYDMRHTFGRRLRSVGVSFEDRQVSPGESQRIIRQQKRRI